jgi:cytochrome bd-type quinol oxidase subunit 2
MPEKKTKTLAILAFVCSILFPIIVTFTLMAAPYSFSSALIETISQFSPALGWVLGALALHQIRKDPTKGGTGYAIAAIVISILFFLLIIIAQFFAHI